MADAWISDEPKLGAVLAHVFRRGLRRPRRIVAIALGVTVAITALRLSRAPYHQATLYLRLSEGDVPADYAAPPPRDVRLYVMGLVLTRARLEAMMRRHGIMVGWLDRDPAGAVDAFRQDLEISVTRNYFWWDRTDDDPPRTAQVAISVSGTDEELAWAVLGDIKDVIVGERAERLAQLERARALLREQLEAARQRTRTLQAEIEQLSTRAARERGDARVALEARVAVHRVAAGGAIREAIALEGALREAEFSGAAERSDLGLAFEVFDQQLSTRSPRLGPAQVAVRAAAAFALAALLAILVGGALDDHLYDPADAAARGIPVLGGLPRFPGDDAGSSRARTAAGA